MDTITCNPEDKGLADIKAVADQNTAASSLRTVRDNLANALEAAEAAMTALRDQIVLIRPTGLLTVDEMAEAIGHDRNYVDSIWSARGETQKGRQTRVTPVQGADETDRQTAAWNLDKAAQRQRATAEAAKTARAERNRVVALVYASKLLGPSAIATEAAVDRNHVLRLARKAGVAPMHRQGSRNQYSA